MTLVSEAAALGLESELRAATRRKRAAKKHLDRVTAEHDQVVRRARAAGITQRRVMELTGLSRPRINQIMRDSRV